MSVCRKLPDGTIQKIAGHTILLDANASEVREGIINIPSLGAGASTTITVTFTDPMPDTDYMVVFDNRTGGSSVSANFADINRTVTGFVCNVQNVDNSTTHSAGTVRYHAFKLVKIEGYTELQNKVYNPDETPTENSTNLCTSGGIYEAIKNASAVWKGTKSEWTALPVTDKKTYDLAVLVDAKLIKAVNRTDGSDTDVADLGQIWKGTRTEWEALSLAERKTHGVAFFTDKRYAVSVDPTTGDESNLVDWTGVWKGSMEDWEALTDAEKDEWDVCITPTIAASDTNPFRTLSDPEQITLASNVDYECPHDGFINFISPSDAGVAVTINGVEWGRSVYSQGVSNSNCAPVQKGDVVRYNSSGSVQVYARWYTNEVSPGEPDTPVLYRSQSLDWDNKVVVTNAELYAGYTCPSDGYFICGNIPYSSSADFEVNGHYINFAYFNSNNNWSAFGVQIPVQKGDVCKVNVPLYTGWDSYEPNKFVPYKDYPDYSTTEHWTGRRWIDGKKIYSKVVQLPSIVSVPTSWGTIPSMPSDIDVLVSFSVLRKDSGATGIKSMVDVIRSGSGAFTWVASHDTIGVNVLVVEYTKTTDD